ncbi:putative photosynthetic complex assembly protein PuhE [uncultured Salinisphaera sp.]|uniref:putative photosynthetic complex assembly protein PuhE n=1 Tax=uncultured Salinisphaera sp. TaxID=359372 RepID=UPI0032B20BEF
MGLPVAFAIFIWWFTTGGLFLLNTGNRTTRRWSLVAGRWSLVGVSVVAALSFLGILVTRDDQSVSAAYIAFSCGLLIWGWQTLTYYTGTITGPRDRACPPQATGWRRFGYGLAASLWHELAAVAGAVAIAWICIGHDNMVALWTYLVLWSMHVSAKINLFLGVRNTGDTFLPTRLAYLTSFFKKRRMNALFPISVTAGTAIVVLSLDTALALEASQFTLTAGLLVGTLAALAVLEHLCLFLPIPADWLWRWTQTPTGVAPPGPTAPGRARSDENGAGAHNPARSS